MTYDRSRIDAREPEKLGSFEGERKGEFNRTCELRKLEALAAGWEREDEEEIIREARKRDQAKARYRGGNGLPSGTEAS